ncbi:MAG: class I SAM-dependent methyltransferase [Candidatus Hodarchaeales archaeon]
MTDDMRRIVESGYDEGDYEKHFRSSLSLTSYEQKFIEKMIELIPEKSNILDMGSGTGIPIDKYLVDRGYHVTGIDLSQKHVNMARINVPGANFIKNDFTKFEFEQRYYAIICTYALFHVPRKEHRDLIRKVKNILLPGGLFLLTTGLEDMPLDVYNFIGSRMAWSSFSSDKYIFFLKQEGFAILLKEEIHDGDEHHQWILAQQQ